MHRAHGFSPFPVSILIPVPVLEALELALHSSMEGGTGRNRSNMKQGDLGWTEGRTHCGEDYHWRGETWETVKSLGKEFMEFG